MFRQLNSSEAVLFRSINQSIINRKTDPEDPEEPEDPTDPPAGGSTGSGQGGDPPPGGGNG